MKAFSAKPLWALTAGVVAAHVLLLRPASQTVQQPEPAHAKSFVTRTVAVVPPPPATPPQAVPVAPSPPRPAPRAAARPPTDAGVAATIVAAATQPETKAPAATPVAFAVAIPRSMRLQYKVEVRKSGLSLQASSELRWRHDADSYEARLEVSAPLLPTRTQSSTGRITPEGLAPLRFAEKGRTEEAAHFERDKGKVTFSSNRPDAPLLAGAQDRLSVLLQLAALIAGEPAKFPAGTSMTIQTAGTRESEPWIFTVEGPEELQLPGGRVAALKLSRAPRREYDLKVELWLAPGMDYAPVRLRLTQPNGDSVDQQWSSTDRG